MAKVRKPWISVIMPSYNGERWIDRALVSLTRQSTEGIELLLIDGGPSSAASDAALKYAGRVDIRIFSRPDLANWHSKTNFGVEMALADHICWLHVDDIWLPSRSGVIRRWVEMLPDVALQWGPSAIIDENDKALGILHSPFASGQELSPRQLLERLLVQNFISAPAPIFRKDAWQTAGGLDENLWYTADWDIWLKLARLGGARYHGEVTCGYRIHSGSLTVAGSNDLEDFERQLQVVLDRHMPAVTGGDKVERAARASMRINVALASASSRKLKSMAKIAIELIRLGPSGAARYARDSRIIERLAPRLRARARGSF
jgi:hypothetical protein